MSAWSRVSLSPSVFQQEAVGRALEEQQSKQAGGAAGAAEGICCQTCGKPCRGEALRVQNKHFHIKCFVCKGETSLRFPASGLPPHQQGACEGV